ncbi:MAG: hypothetical protein JNK65_00070 [Deltaproteobacteria bacterium]|nr:hypothetical protein [Deltaproteobacteria bacterium]
MFPKETLSEILFFLAEHESFSSVQKLGSLTPNQVKEALRSLASELKQQAIQEQDLSKVDYKKLDELSPKVKQVLSTLTPREFHTLFKNFGYEA